MFLHIHKIFREFRPLKYQFSINCRSSSGIGNHFIFPLFSHSALSCFKLTQCNSYSTVAEGEGCFPLRDISNLNISSLNHDYEKVLKIVTEISEAKSKGKKLPEYMNLREIDDLLDCETYCQRQKYLSYLFKKQQTKLHAAEKKLRKKLDFENKSNIKETNTDGHIQYGLGKNTLLLRTWKKCLNSFYDKRLASNALFGQKIVIDLSYNDLMTRKEKRSCASQLRLLYSTNRLNRDPYDLYFCNADTKSLCVQYLHEEVPTIGESLTELCEQSYLDIFPKEDLVYLSPHASETLETYDHKAIYIIGAFVDTVKREAVSADKAEEEGIKSYSLPLDKYILWRQGSRSLSINQVFSIMQTMRDTGDWKEAFKHVPTRKVRKVAENSEEKQFVSDKVFVMSN